MNRFLIAVAAALIGCSSYGQQSGPGARFAAASDSHWSDGASQFIGASASAEATVRDADARGALAYAAADERERQSAAAFNERMTLSARIGVCNDLLQNADGLTRGQHEACTAAVSQAHQREVYERNGYPPYYFGYGYGFLPGATDILAPGAVAGVYSRGWQNPSGVSTTDVKRVEKGLAELAGRQRDLETNINVVASARTPTNKAEPAKNAEAPKGATEGAVAPYTPKK